MGVALDCRQPKSAAHQLLNMKKSKSLKSEIEFNKWLKKTRAINTRVRIDQLFSDIAYIGGIRAKPGGQFIEIKSGNYATEWPKFLQNFFQSFIL